MADSNRASRIFPLTPALGPVQAPSKMQMSGFNG
jgi:hypothetical protein